MLTLLAKKNYFISCFLEIKNSHICRKKLRLTLETSSSSRHRIVAGFQVIIFMLLCGVCFVLTILHFKRSKIVLVVDIFIFYSEIFKRQLNVTLPLVFENWFFFFFFSLRLTFVLDQVIFIGWLSAVLSNILEVNLLQGALMNSYS